MNVASNVERTHELSEVLHREARLLDDGRFEDWLEMLAPDLAYRAPVVAEVAIDDEPAAGLQLMYFDDALANLHARVFKLRTGLDQAEIPASRTVRLVSNVVVDAADAAGCHPVASAFILYRHRRQRDVEILAGHRDDLWRPDPEGWRLVRREIRFAANVLPTKSLSLFY